MDREFVCEARVKFQGRELHLNRIIARFDLEEIMPPRVMITDPSDFVLFEEASERRKRFIDMVASGFAHALTEAMFKEARGQG